MHSQGTMIFLAKRGYKTFFAHHDLEVLSPEIEDRTEKDLEILETHLNNIKNNQEKGKDNQITP